MPGFNKRHVEDMREFIFSKYPSGIMNGQLIISMPPAQIIAIYNNIKNRKTVVPGQMSLFEASV